MDVGIIVNIFLSILSFALAAISVVTVVITLKQNNKMLESNSRPYVVTYLVYQETPSHIYFCIKNFGKTSAVVNELKIEPVLSLHKKTCNDVVHNTMLAPNQQLHFLVSAEDKDKMIYEQNNCFFVEIKYTDCCTKKVYEESYNINMEYIMTVLSVQHNKSNFTPEQNALYNIERILDYTKNSNM